MKKQHVIGGIVILILGIFIYLSTTGQGFFNAYEICKTLKIFEPCGETVGWIGIISIILILFGIVDLIYGLATSYDKIEEKKIIKDFREKIYIRCPKCRYKNEEDAKYCKECGYVLSKEYD